MKKLLKSEICGFVNSAHRTVYYSQEKSNISAQKKKKKAKMQNMRLLQLPKRTPNLQREAK